MTLRDDWVTSCTTSDLVGILLNRTNAYAKVYIQNDEGEDKHPVSYIDVGVVTHNNAKKFLLILYSVPGYPPMNSYQIQERIYSLSKDFSEEIYSAKVILCFEEGLPMRAVKTKRTLDEGAAFTDEFIIIPKQEALRDMNLASSLVQ
jgi:hypothetical protein